MRDPARARNIALAVFAAGLAVLLGSLAWAITADSGIAGALIAIAIVPTLGGLMAAIIYGAQARNRRRLLAGQGVIARWRVGAERWAAFVALERKLAAEPDAIGNVLDPCDGARDVEVLIGPEAVLVDDVSYDFGGGVPFILGAAMRFGPPLCLEIALYYPSDGGSGGTDRRVLRLPVGAGADSAAARARAHFAALAERGAP